MTDHPDWPDQAIQDWLQMQHYKAIDGSIDLRLPVNVSRVTASEEISVSRIDISDFYRTQEDEERAAAIEKALEAWRM